MATTPTSNPIPSEAPQDLKFNAGKIDEFVTSDSQYYIDRFGVNRRTISGINYDSNQAMLNYGYITKDSFEDGSTLSLANECLRWKSNGEFYRWDGPLPKVVPAGSTPEVTGGIGKGKWVGVGDASLRGDLNKDGGVDLVRGAAKQSDLDSLSVIVDDRNYPKYKRAAEIAKLLQDAAGGSPFSIDCYGDSTMWGATSNNISVQDPNNPPATLKATLANLYKSIITVNNNGFSGTTLAQMIAGTDGSGKTFEARISASSALLAYCNHAINDSQLNNDIHQYRFNLIEFVRLCRKYNKVPVLVTPNINPMSIGGAIITEEKSKRLEKYADVMRTTAQALDCDLVDNWYYFTKTTRMVSPQTLVPDGAHPSSAAYQMYGRNLAIPLVSARTLSSCWDKAGFANTTYFDNVTTGRSFFDTGNPFNRFNGGITGRRTTSPTGINLAVILDSPTDDTVLAAYGPQWSTGTTSALSFNGSTADPQWGGYINQNSFLSPLDWEACFIPERSKMYAGLHVVGVISQGSFGGEGTDYGLCGVGLIPRITCMSAMASPTELRNYPIIGAQTTINFTLNLFSSGTAFSLNGCANDNAALNIDWSGNGSALVLTGNGSTYTIAPSVNTGSYLCTIRFNFDKSITITVGIANVTIPASSAAYPNMYVSTKGMIHNIKYSG